MLVDKVEALVTERRHASLRTPTPTSVILSGEMEEECITLDEDGKTVKSRAQVDPRETLRRVLYDSGLDDVRSVLEQLPSSSWLA